MVEACKKLAERWLSSNADYSKFDNSDIKNLTSMQVLQFLSELFNNNVTLELVKALENVYKFDSSENAEIKCKWLRLCIKARWSEKVQKALQFVNDQGRMKYVRPIYRDLYSWEDMRSAAIDNFNKNKKYMMFLSVYTIKKDLHIED